MTDNHEVYLGLGSNLGNKEENIRIAIEMINQHVGKVKRQSDLHITEPWGFESDNSFINAAVCCETQLNPRQVLQQTQYLERSMGRLSKTEDKVYHDRIIDIDILMYDDWIVDEPDLKIPHPLMNERDFVLKPLGEILHRQKK